jgi:hypothetical protein
MLDQLEEILRLLLAQLKAARGCPVHGNGQLEIAFDIRCGACARNSHDETHSELPHSVPLSGHNRKARTVP